MTRLLSLGHMCDLHACAYGGSRPKLTSFLGTVPGLESSKFCPGDHEHRPWGVDEKGQFRTAEDGGSLGSFICGCMWVFFGQKS